jgi:hypothetical protein
VPRRLAVAAALACAAALLPAQSPPLAPFAAERLAVFPLQGFTAAPGATGTAAAAWGAAVDALIADSLGARGLADQWRYARDLDAGWRRNRAYVSDPRLLGAMPLRGGDPRKLKQLPEPFAGRLRAHLGVAGSRYALVPVHLHLAAPVADSVVGTLRVVVVDGRVSQVLMAWDAEIRSPAPLDPAGAGRIGRILADLVSPPPPSDAP